MARCSIPTGSPATSLRSARLTRTLQVPPAHEQQPRNETVQRHRECHHPDGGQVRERGDQHKLQGILALCKASGSQDAVELYLSPVCTHSLSNVVNDGKDEEEGLRING
ncbi:MAG: hypothetical protein ACXVIR_12235 [Halobacteriota archaeon]